MLKIERSGYGKYEGAVREKPSPRILRNVRSARLKAFSAHECVACAAGPGATLLASARLYMLRNFPLPYDEFILRSLRRADYALLR